MPPLLFLLRPPTVGPVLSAGADLAALPVAVLLQRSQLAGQRTAPRRDSLPDGRQRLCPDRRLETGPDSLGRLPDPSLERRPQRAGPPVCALPQTVPQRLL